MIDVPTYFVLRRDATDSFRQSDIGYSLTRSLLVSSTVDKSVRIATVADTNQVDDWHIVILT